MIKVRTVNPHIGMAELLRGAKAGAVSGIIFGALLGSIGNIGLNLINGIINGNLEYFVASLTTERMMSLGPIIVYIIFGVIGGLIFGLMFAAIYEKLPGKTPKSKGIVTSIIFWVVLILGFPALYNLYRWGFEEFYWFVRGSFYQEQAVIGLGTSILWGWLLGRFWERARARTLMVK
jgi:hypothetical protein